METSPQPAPGGSSEQRLRHVLVGIALLSASLLAYQILLTRVSALRLHFHFGFLVISNCLLGFGASGTLLVLTEPKWSANPRLWMWRLTGAYIASLVITWLFLLTFPVPDTLNFTGIGEVIQFTVFNLAAALPFFVGGGAVGLMLSAHADRVHRVYALDLLGAGAGCLLVPPLLWYFGAGGTFAALFLLGLGAWVALAPAQQRKQKAILSGVLALVGLVAIPTLDRLTPVPGKGWLDLTNQIGAYIARSNEHSRWSANSRIDVLPIPAEKRFILARGIHAQKMPLPDQKFILQDGDAGTVISNYSEAPAGPLGLASLRRSLYSASSYMKQGTNAEVFIIGVGGGNDVWAAKIHGAKRIRAIELNRGVLEVHREVAPHFSRGILEDPSIELVVDEGRSALMRDTSKYDIVQMTGIDTWTSLTSGAYILAENYLYTVEACQQMLDHLKRDGYLQLTRMALEMETLRLLVNLETALKSRGQPGLEQSVAVFTTPDWLTTTIVKKGTFTPAEVDKLNAFTREHGIGVQYLPHRDFKGPVPQFIKMDDKQAFIDSFPRDISPTYDDKPYFFNFTRWGKPLQSVKFIREPTKVSQGNPAFILGQLGISTVLAATFIIVPLLIARRREKESNEAPQRRGLGAYLVYFAAVGVGFIAIEVALMQKLTLLLGKPLYSIVVTLFTLLVFTGLGSMLSDRWLKGVAPARAMWVPAGVCAYLVLTIFLGRPAVDSVMSSSTPVRMLVAVAIMAPVGLLLGMPFAYGIDRIRRVAPHHVPWAWAVNGCSTVVGSVATVVASMNLGFNAVLGVAGGLYALAFASLLATPSSESAGASSADSDEAGSSLSQRDRATNPSA